jgi:hypothetical protein
MADVARTCVPNRTRLDPPPGRPMHSALRHDPELAAGVALISFMTAAEVERWAMQYRSSEHRLHWLHP